MPDKLQRLSEYVKKKLLAKKKNLPHHRKSELNYRECYPYRGKRR